MLVCFKARFSCTQKSSRLQQLCGLLLYHIIRVEISCIKHLPANKELAPAEKESGQKTQERLDRQRTDPQTQTASMDMDSPLTAGEKSSASDKSISLDVGHSLNQRTESNVSNRSTRREPRRTHRSERGKPRTDGSRAEQQGWRHEAW